MTKVGWNAIATWRDLRMGESGDLWHRSLIDPALLSLVGPVKGLNVLDIGCGNGYLTRRFKRQGATRAVGVDASSGSIRLARRREGAHPSGAEFVHGDAARLARFDAGSFDRIVANMSLMDIRDAAGTIREIGRLLSPRGRFVFSINHPCFDIDEFSSWVVERHPYRETVARKVEGYRRERPVRVAWKLSETEMAYTTSHHRTLATYARYLRNSGLAILRLVEPAPKPELIRNSDQGPFIAEIPLHLVVEAARFEDRGPMVRTWSRSGQRSRLGNSRTIRSRPIRHRSS
jgi:ubiquinone/menaquinone biosynthesis C-methylase UbiE